MNDRPRQRILIVDDDRHLAGMLSELLETEGYACSVAHNGAHGLRAAAEHLPDLIVLDVMMPGDDGITTLRALRQTMNTPVIMLTAMGEDDDRVLGLEAGADDYLAKPFVPRELLLRIAAILRRTANGPAGERQQSRFQAGALEIQLDKQRATIGSEKLDLTNAELRILAALVAKPGAVVSREQLTRYALGRELSPFDRALDTHISHLRRKLSAAAEGELAIRSVRGAGYRLIVD